MNCRPGDLARVLSPGRMARCSCGATAVAIKPDTLVVVTRHDGIAWILQDPIAVTVSLPCGVLVAARCTGLNDDILRPIRDPGDDAVDEMVEKMGAAPKTLTEVREVSHG